MNPNEQAEKSQPAIPPLLQDEPGSGLELERGNLRVSWVELGEGYDGDYDETDEEDVELLRFDVHQKVDGEWVEVEDCSFCTHFPVAASSEEQARGLEFLMNRLYPVFEGGGSLRRTAQRLSWIERAWLDAPPQDI